MRQSKDKQRQAMAVQEEKLRAQSEAALYGMRKQLSEHWARAAVLWAEVDGMREKSQDAYRNAAIEMENAADLLTVETNKNESRLIGIETAEDQDD